MYSVFYNGSYLSHFPLICPFTSKNNSDGLQDGPEIHAEAALADVLQVELYHVVEVQVRAPSHLPVTGESGLHRQALHGPGVVLGNLVGQGRARAHHRHLAQEDVDELGELVDGMFAQEAANAGDARVVLYLEHRAVGLVAPLQLLQALVGVLVHAAELVHGELVHAPVAVRAADALLAVDGAARALQADRRADQGARDEARGYHGTGKYDVEDAAAGAVHPLALVGVAQVLHGLVAVVRARLGHVFGALFAHRHGVVGGRIDPLPRFRLYPNACCS